jgi:hypothetical protein
LSGGKNGTLRDDTSAGTICVTIHWKEVCKFLSGAFFVSAGVLFYLYLAARRFRCSARILP